MIRWRLDVILGGGFIIQQGSTACLAVCLLTQAVGECIIPMNNEIHCQPGQITECLVPKGAVLHLISYLCNFSVEWWGVE